MEVTGLKLRQSRAQAISFFIVVCGLYVYNSVDFLMQTRSLHNSIPMPVDRAVSRTSYVDRQQASNMTLATEFGWQGKDENTEKQLMFSYVLTEIDWHILEIIRKCNIELDSVESN